MPGETLAQAPTFSDPADPSSRIQWRILRMYVQPPPSLPAHLCPDDLDADALRYSQAVYPPAWRPLMCEQAVSQNHHLRGPSIHNVLHTPAAALTPVSGRDPVGPKCLTESPSALPLLRVYPFLPGFSSSQLHERPHKLPFLQLY